MSTKMIRKTANLLLITGCMFWSISAGGQDLGDKENNENNASKSGEALLPGVKAFPGAEGFGAYSAGGRGGDVYIVTNLNDDGPGSLREAVEASGARTVVFAVSGTIELQSRLLLENDSITIAGQTAPGDGITLKNYNLSIYNVENVIIRYIRSRLGADKRGDFDAMSGRFANDVIVDHCSFSWSIDETVGNYDNYHMTIQWCIISESLHNAHHSEGSHGMGAFIGGQGFSFHHNLLANHHNRTPRLCGARYGSDPDLEMVDSRNNVLFNWVTNSCYGGEGGDYNIVNNYYKPGPATYGAVERRIVAPRDEDGMWGEFFVAGNYVEGYPDVTADNTLGIDEVPTAMWEQVITNTPFAAAEVQTQTPQDAYVDVLKHAGASFPKRDKVDARATEDTRTGMPKYTGSYIGIIDNPDDVGGYPVLESEPPPIDSDKDGMPDEWEDANGLDKNNMEDGKIIQADGYSNLEHYLNSLVIDFPFILRPMEVSALVNDLTVDLSWTDLSDDEDGFILERAEGEGDFELLADLEANTESFTDNTVTTYGDYTYRLKAYNAELETCFTEGLEVEVADPNPPNYSISVDVEGSGSVIMNPEADDYQDGAEVVMLAIPDTGWEFGGWNGDVSGADNPIVLTMDSDKTITVTFNSVNSVSELINADHQLLVYPNPMKYNAVISFNLIEPGVIEISLFDIHGKMIREIANGYFLARENQIAFDGTHLDPGIYYLGLRSKTDIRRNMIIVQ